MDPRLALARVAEVGALGEAAAADAVPYQIPPVPARVAWGVGAWVGGANTAEPTEISLSAATGVVPWPYYGTQPRGGATMAARAREGTRRGGDVAVLPTHSNVALKNMVARGAAHASRRRRVVDAAVLRTRRWWTRE